MANSNSTFCGGDPTWANACVGDNGDPGCWEYARGFSRAANLLIEQVLKDEGMKCLVDEFVYPVCFNMRHSIELRLKGAIEQLQALVELTGDKLDFDLAGSHDIGLIWEFYDSKSRAFDARYTEINKNLENKVLEIAEVDATGQTFRYPFSTESRKHLVDVALINFINIKDQFSSLESGLDMLHRLNTFLIDEYSQGSFTKHLPRNKLRSLAKKLPERHAWAEGSFDAARRGLKQAFGLSSRELSSAINIIQEHFEFAPLIGIVPPLKGVTEVEVSRFFKEWVKLHAIPSDSTSVPVIIEADDSKNWFKDMASQERTKEEIWNTISDLLTPEVLAGLAALYYFEIDLDFSERYIARYRTQLGRAKSAFSQSQDEVKQKFFHILMKMDAMYCFVRSLYFLNQTDLAENLVATYELERKFPWLDEARSRQLFRKPDYCGYTD